MGATILTAHGIAKRFACTADIPGCAEGLGARSAACPSAARPARSRSCTARSWNSRGWLSEKEYLSALNFCMLLPGPEAMQLATYAGWKLHGVRGGLAAGLLFVLPGAAIVLALTILYATFGQLPLVEALSSASRRRCWPSSSRRCCAWPGVHSPRAPTGSSPASPFWRSSPSACPFRSIIAAAALYGFLRGGLRSGRRTGSLAASGPAVANGDDLERGVACAARACWHFCWARSMC